MTCLPLRIKQAKIQLDDTFSDNGYSGGLDQYNPCALEHRFVLKAKKNQINHQYVNMIDV